MDDGKEIEVNMGGGLIGSISLFAATDAVKGCSPPQELEEIPVGGIVSSVEDIHILPTF